MPRKKTKSLPQPVPPFVSEPVAEPVAEPVGEQESISEIIQSKTEVVIDEALPNLIKESLRFIQTTHPEIVNLIQNYIADERNKILDLQLLFNQSKLELQDTIMKFGKDLDNYKKQIEVLTDNLQQFAKDELEKIELKNIQIKKVEDLIQSKEQELDSISKKYIRNKNELQDVRTEYDKVIVRVAQLEKELTEKVQSLNEWIAKGQEYQNLLKKYKSKCILL